MLIVHKLRVRISCPFVLLGPHLSSLDSDAVSCTSRRNDRWFENLIILNREGTFNVQALHLNE